MSKAFQKFGSLAIAIALGTAGAVSAEAQRKAPAVEPSVAESVKPQQAPRIRLPQQQTAPAAPQREVPVQVDVTGPRVRLPGSRISNRQRKQLAEGLAERALTGVGGPTFVEYDKLQVSVPRKITTALEGTVLLRKGIGLSLLARDFRYESGQNTRVPRFNHSRAGVGVLPVPGEADEYFLAEMHYDIADTRGFQQAGRQTGLITPYLQVSYELNGDWKSEPLTLSRRRDEGGGTFAFLVDQDSSRARNFFSGVSFVIEAADVTIKAIEIRPVR